MNTLKSLDKRDNFGNKHLLDMTLKGWNPQKALKLWAEAVSNSLDVRLSKTIHVSFLGFYVIGG